MPWRRPWASFVVVAILSFIVGFALRDFVRQDTHFLAGLSAQRPSGGTDGVRDGGAHVQECPSATPCPAAPTMVPSTPTVSPSEMRSPSATPSWGPTVACPACPACPACTLVSSLASTPAPSPSVTAPSVGPSPAGCTPSPSRTPVPFNSTIPPPPRLPWPDGAAVTIQAGGILPPYADLTGLMPFCAGTPTPPAEAAVPPVFDIRHLAVSAEIGSLGLCRCGALRLQSSAQTPIARPSLALELLPGPGSNGQQSVGQSGPSAPHVGGLVSAAGE